MPFDDDDDEFRAGLAPPPSPRLETIRPPRDANGIGMAIALTFLGILLGTGLIWLTRRAPLDSNTCETTREALIECREALAECR